MHKGSISIPTPFSRSPGFLKKGVIWKILILFLWLTSPIHGEVEINRSQISYLMQAKQIENSISLYLSYFDQMGQHDFEILQQMALILLEQGARSKEKEIQILSVYGSAIAGSPFSLDILEAGIKSDHAETQIAAIQFLGSMQDDRSDELLVKAMSSPFFFARMEAAMHLATRKHKAAVGHIESLMHRVPPQARFLFPQFFALIGTSDAIAILRHLIEDRTPAVRVEALLSAARFGRDDLLPLIRMNVTHLNVAEQEAAAYALGLLQDSKSIRKLRRLHQTGQIAVKIAAARALHLLGDKKAKDFLIQKAKKGNLFAIAALADISQGCDALATLCSHNDATIRLNAAHCLLRHRDVRCSRSLIEFLVKDTRDMGFLPKTSLGKTMLAFQPVYSANQKKDSPYDIRSTTLMLRQQILIESALLPEEEFLTIAEAIFSSKQSDLIPILISLLENLQTQRTVELLKKKGEVAGAPLIRGYCHLALYRLGKGKESERLLKEYIQRNRGVEMIRFRPLVPIDQRLDQSTYELTPEDSSRLLIEIFQAFSNKQQESSIATLLEAIRNGNPRNRHVLAGLLLRTLQ